MFFSNPPRTFCGIWFSLTMVVLVGCSGFRKNRTNDFVKPLASASNEIPNDQQHVLPDEQTLCIETAKTVAEKGHVDEAIKLYQRAEELGASQKMMDERLAPLYAHAGEFELAIERYERLALLSPKDADLCNNFAWTLMDCQRYEEAIEEATRGLSLDENNQRLRTTLAMVHYRQGDRDSALAEFAKAKDASAAHHNVAVLDIDAGDLESARRHLDQVRRISGGNLGKRSPLTETLLSAINQQDVGE